MIIYIAFIAALLLIGSRVCRGFNETYIDKDNCNAVKGVFILLILASHFSQYVDAYQAPLDTMYWWVRIALGQCVVSMFLFYSGYGVTLSGVRHGENYIRQMPEKRLLRTLLAWMLSQVIFLAIQLCLGNRYSVGDMFSAFFALKSFGNDNWYIMDILLLYLISWVAFLRYKDTKQVVMFTWIATIGMVCILCGIGKKAHFYNTLLCYPLGCTYVLIKDFTEKKLKNNITYICSLAVAVFLYLVAHKYWNNSIAYMLTAVLFSIVVLLITMKVKIGNRLLRYCGEHLQGLFLVHRVPMILLKNVNCIYNNVYIYFCLSVILAFAVEIVFSKILRFMQKRMMQTV